MLWLYPYIPPPSKRSNRACFGLNKSKRKELESKKQDFVNSVTKTFIKELNERGAIGSISELYDSKSPYLPKGTIAQAWSVANIFRIIKQYWEI